MKGCSVGNSEKNLPSSSCSRKGMWTYQIIIPVHNVVEKMGIQAHVYPAAPWFMHFAGQTHGNICQERLDCSNQMGRGHPRSLIQRVRNSEAEVIERCSPIGSLRMPRIQACGLAWSRQQGRNLEVKHPDLSPEPCFVQNETGWR